MIIEKCAGCGMFAQAGKTHPIAGVMHVNDAEGLGFQNLVSSEQGFVQVPVCKACHESPEHRVFPLKCHFFPRVMSGAAVQRAGQQSIGS